MNIRRILLTDALNYVVGGIQITLQEGENKGGVTTQRMKEVLKNDKDNGRSVSKNERTKEVLQHRWGS